MTGALGRPLGSRPPAPGMTPRELTPMTVVATQLADARLNERRRYRRVGLTLSGRYLLGERDEHPCRTFDVSPGGIAILSMRKGFVGERVVAYFDHIGRI